MVNIIEQAKQRAALQQKEQQSHNLKNEIANTTIQISQMEQRKEQLKAELRAYPDPDKMDDKQRTQFPEDRQELDQLRIDIPAKKQELEQKTGELEQLRNVEMPLMHGEQIQQAVDGELRVGEEIENPAAHYPSPMARIGQVDLTSGQTTPNVSGAEEAINHNVHSEVIQRSKQQAQELDVEKLKQYMEQQKAQSQEQEER